MANIIGKISPSPSPSNTSGPSPTNPSAPSTDQATTRIKQKIVKCSTLGNVSEDDYYDPDRLGQKIFPHRTDSNGKIVLPVKIFISNISPGMTNAAKMLNFFKKDALLFGPAHAGLQFGNVVIDWNQSSLVHIGELKASTATVLFEIHNAIRVTYTPELEQKAVAFIQKWNADRKYSYREYNCHRFVKDFLNEVLSMSLHQCFQGAIGEFIERVVKTGDPTPQLKLANYENRVVKFTSHKELEAAELERYEEEKNLIPLAQRKWNLTKEEVKLLKVFHRGFQLQEAAIENSEHTDCFYGHPTMVLEVL